MLGKSGSLLPTPVRILVSFILSLPFYSGAIPYIVNPMTAPYWLDLANPELFPDVALALRDPDGLLAVGGDLSEARLLAAYRRGIFPWYSDDQPILWWSPDPRLVLFPERLHISRSLKKTLKKAPFDLSMDQAFDQVILACSEPRADQPGTWITEEMRLAYERLHQAGHAHSVECWQDNKLVGGLYGIAIGKVFFGESMFSRVNNASKLAFVSLTRQLQQWQFGLIDCQVESAHLNSLGASPIRRSEFIQYLNVFCEIKTPPTTWQFDPALLEQLQKTGGILDTLTA